MLKSTEKLSDDVLVLRFTNGFDVAYEKGVQDEFRVFKENDTLVERRTKVRSKITVKYSSLPIIGKKISGGDNSADIYTHEARSFSSDAHYTIDDYLSKRELNVEDFTTTAKHLFDACTAQLQINKFTYRDWNEYRTGGIIFLLALGWPILVPYYLIDGHKRDHCRDYEQAILYAPLMLPFVLFFSIKELIAPKTFLTEAYRVNDKSSVLHKQNRGDDPAVVFSYGDNPKTFSSLEIFFPNGMSLTDRNLDDPRRLSNGEEYAMEKYRTAKFFIRPDDNLIKQVHDLNERKGKSINASQEFYRQLTESDHGSILKRVGFL